MWMFKECIPRSRPQMWRYRNVNDNEVDVEEEILNENGLPLEAPSIKMSLSKKHDNWLLKCQRSYLDENSSLFALNWFALNESIAVRFRMRRDDASQETADCIWRTPNVVYEVLSPDTPTYVPTDMCHQPYVLDIVLGHKIKRPMHVEVVYDMDTQHLPILMTVGTSTSNSPPATLRQCMDWEKFQTSLEALHLGSSFKTAADVKASTNLLVNRIKEAQARATTLLPASTSRHVHLPLSIKKRTATQTQAT
ncbi:hypothetical protein EVAR_35508_1 [Eumeta japonica]|uniref:Uncharacterized protein n=1 Tax=Eumeta variegata TaxID=151549 RepID=A0A4C1X8P8_EUMVA|nr:hypothetical protein EVAR_35508_1 [Eumeta japonica]